MFRAAIPVVRMVVIILSTVTAFVSAQDASAQAHPAKPVKLIVGFPPGGGSDARARLRQCLVRLRQLALRPDGGARDGESDHRNRLGT
jgi:hypothetical protein